MLRQVSLSTIPIGCEEDFRQIQNLSSSFCIFAPRSRSHLPYSNSGFRGRPHTSTAPESNVAFTRNEASPPRPFALTTLKLGVAWPMSQYVLWPIATLCLSITPEISVLVS